MKIIPARIEDGVRIDEERLALLVAEFSAHILQPDTLLLSDSQGEDRAKYDNWMDKCRAYVLHVYHERMRLEGVGKYTVNAVNLLVDYPRNEIENEFSSCMKKGHMAGLVLAQTWRLDRLFGNGSVNKAVLIASGLSRMSESFIRKAWSEYKNVAHLFAAQRLLLYIKKSIDNNKQEYADFHGLKEGSPRYLAGYFAFSLDLCTYATQKVDKRTKKPLLTEDELFMFDERLLKSALALSGNAPVPRLSSLKMSASLRERKLLGAYKANSRF